jgi:tol-pal system protein YbgF
MWRLLLAATLCGAVALPVGAQGLFDDAEARRRIETLRRQVEANQQAIDERLARIEAGVDDRRSVAERAVLDLASQLEALRSDIANLRGNVETLAHQIETAARRQRDLYVDIDTRLRNLEKAREEAEAAAAAAAAAAAEAAAVKPPVGPLAAAPAGGDPTASEARAYQAALDQFKLGNYAHAVSAMQGFLVTYPNSPLAPNAQYWIGMAHSGQRDYKSAIEAQRKVLAAWPDSAKAPDAMLSIAAAQETMGDRRSALKTLEELIALYPSSGAAASAKQRLAATQGSARR